MTIVILIIVGLGLGSFTNALAWRSYKQTKSKAKKYSIVSGRSMCPHCKRELKVADLVPVFSWLALRGKCRYCGEKISWQYPLVELAIPALFVGSYVFWPVELNHTLAWIDFGFWLASLTGLVALTIVDIRHMILPNKIIFPLIWLIVSKIIIDAVADSSINPITTALFGVAIGGGLFYLLFQLSSGKWIGGGDVKLGFMLGLLIGGPASATIMLFLASLAGTVFSLPMLLAGRLTPKTRIPFGPFLIAGAIITGLFNDQILDIYYKLFL